MKICGRNSNSQLQITDKEGDFLDTPCDFHIDPSLFSSFSTNYYQTVWVNQNGEAYAIGNNSQGIISGLLPKRQFTEEHQIWFNYEHGKKCKFHSVVCGGTYTLYLVSDEKDSNFKLVYCHENNSKNPLFLNIGNRNPRTIFGGNQTCCSIDSEGGINIITNSVLKFSNRQIKVTVLPGGDKPVKIACCDKFAISLGRSGKVYECKIPDFSSDPIKFEEIKFFSLKKVVDVAGIIDFCFVVLEDGSVYGRGSNMFCALGMPNEIRMVEDFTKIDSLSKFKITSAFTGGCHSIFLTNERKMVVCGNNNFGQLFLSCKNNNNKIFPPVKADDLGPVSFCIVGGNASAAFIGTDPPRNIITTENEELKMKNSQMEVEMKKYKDTISDLKMKNSQMEIEMKKYKDTISDLKMKNSQMEVEMKKYKDTISDLKMKNSQMEIEMKKYKDTVSDLKMKNSQMEIETKKYKENIEKLKKFNLQLEKGIKEDKENIKKLEDENSNKNIELKKYKDIHEKLKNENSNIQNEINKYKENNKKLEEEKSKIQITFEKLKHQKKVIKSEEIFYNIEDYNESKSVIGEGGYGKVYIVTNKKNKQKYAIKIFNINEQNKIDQNMFLDESFTLLNLHHKSIVKFIGINFQSYQDKNNYQPSIMTEYMKNGSIKNVLNNAETGNAHMDWDGTKKYICLIGIADSMRFLHKKGILHRDLKPDNVLLDDDFYPKICDFGLSLSFPNELTNSMELSIQNKAGTLFYMAPELFEEEISHFTRSIDVYSFGILAYEIISGKQPYLELGDINQFNFMKKVIEGYRPILNDNDFSEKMKVLISKCWNKDPKKRPSFDYIYEELTKDFSYSNDIVNNDEIELYMDLMEEEDHM